MSLLKQDNREQGKQNNIPVELQCLFEVVILLRSHFTSSVSKLLLVRLKLSDDIVEDEADDETDGGGGDRRRPRQNSQRAREKQAAKALNHLLKYKNDAQKKREKLDQF